MNATHHAPGWEAPEVFTLLSEASTYTHMWEAMGAGCSGMTPDVLMLSHYNASHLVCGILSSSSSWGTGMVLDEQHVLTCAHVVDGKFLCCVM